MSNTNSFNKSLKFSLQWEGGYVNHPSDPGGATNKGVTQDTYDTYRKSKKLKKRTVKKITDEEVNSVYKTMYWDAVKCNTVKDELALVMFDTAVNFGITGTIEFLQEALNVDVDGDWGSQTQKALDEQNQLHLAETICYGRLSYRDLRVIEQSSQGVFHKGWINRDLSLLKELKNYGLKLNNDIIKETLHIANLEMPPDGYNHRMEVSGPNRGPQVDRYLATAGYYSGVAWCSAFVYYCIKMACYKWNIKEIPFEREGRCGYCPYVEQWAKEHNILSNKPSVGDAFLCVDNISAYHIGFVKEVRDGYVITIEGNTNEAGSSEGIGIFERERNINSNIVFVKWWTLVNSPISSDIEINEIIGSSVYDLYIDEKLIYKMPLIGGKSYAPVRLLGKELGYEVKWIQTNQAVYYNEYRVTGNNTTKIDGNMFAPIRDIVEAIKELKINIVHKKVIISKV